ncbi:MAG: insulinase family protein [Treponema sp.]
MDNLIHGFHIISKTPLEEIQSTGIFARHAVTGLEVYHIYNDDKENLFSFAFMTPPENSRGTAHIIEHSVLCGSKNYPLKDPFLVLSKQSVKTFLNAMTFPDKTVYPASSIIESDYFNLMSVYGDAVFFPLLKRETFEQEGHRLEQSQDRTLHYSGVVLNEMRGAYTDFDSAVDRLSRQSLMEGSIYAYDSGGCPLDIVDLSYEDFCRFHATYYHPVNCKVFLYGNIDTEKQLAFLQERFLRFFEPAEKPAPIPAIPPYSEPRTFLFEAPAGEGKNPDKVSMTMNWLLPESTDIDRLMDVMLLEEVLLGHDGAPLQKRLLECSFAEDVYPYNGGQSELKNLCFTVGLTDLDAGNEHTFEDFILSSLDTIVREGIEPKLIETALNTLDFSNREIIRSGGPFSLILMRRALRGWLHGSTPDASLRYIPAFRRLKKRIAEQPQYTENLIRRFLLENRHRSLVAVRPDPQFCAKLDEALAKKEREAAELLKASGKPAPSVCKQAAQKSSENSDEVQNLIPHILKEDLPPLEDPIPEYLEYLGQVPVIFHEQPANGISYLDIALPADGLSVEDYTYLTLYSAALSSMGTKTEHWASAAADFAYLTGGFSAVTLAAGSYSKQTAVFSPDAVPAADITNRNWILIRSKMLPEYIEQAVSRIFSYLHDISFDDEARLTDIFIQLKNDLDSFPAYAGHSLVSLHAGAAYSTAKQAENRWIGIPQVRFLREWYRNVGTGRTGIRELSRRLSDIHNTLMHSGMLVKVCGTSAEITRMKEVLPAYLSGFGCPHRSTGSFRTGSFEKPAPLCAFPSAVQVGFAGFVLPAAFDETEYGAAMVYAQWIETGMLWEAVRESGGAYGVAAHPDLVPALFSLTTYRDPAPLKSLAYIRAIIEKSCTAPLPDSELNALITGTYSAYLQPRTPAQKSSAAFSRLLNGISHNTRLRIVEGILSCTPQSLRRIAERLTAAIPESTAAVIGSEVMLHQDTAESLRLPPLTVLPSI